MSARESAHSVHGAAASLSAAAGYGRVSGAGKVRHDAPPGATAARCGTVKGAGRKFGSIERRELRRRAAMLARSTYLEYLRQIEAVAQEQGLAVALAWQPANLKG